MVDALGDVDGARAHGLADAPLVSTLGRHMSKQAEEAGGGDEQRDEAEGEEGSGGEAPGAKDGIDGGGEGTSVDHGEAGGLVL